MLDNDRVTVNCVGPVVRTDEYVAAAKDSNTVIKKEQSWIIKQHHSMLCGLAGSPP